MQSARLSTYAPLVLRIGLALVFLNFGADKLLHPDINIATMQGIGAPAIIPFPAANALIACFELLVAFSLLTGAWVRITGYVAAVWIAALILMRGYWNLSQDVGLVGAALAITWLGAGPWSVDAIRNVRSSQSG